MSDIGAIERIVESSPVIVVVLTVAVVVLWRRSERQDAKYEALGSAVTELAKQVTAAISENSQATHALTTAVDRLRERIDTVR